MDILFCEQQRFSNKLFWTILLLLTCLFIYAFIQQVIFHHPFGHKPMTTRGLISAIFFLMFINVLFFNFKLRTTITKEAILIKLSPFHIFTKKFEWSQVVDIVIREYNPRIEYSGWGLRGFKNINFSKSDNEKTKKKWAIELIFHSGQNLLIGTYHPEEAQRAINLAKNSSIN